MQIKEIHEKVFSILENRHQNDTNFTFSLRKTNRFSRLDRGYWFHGNDNYLAVSFWSGMDWKNKTPNIFLVIESGGFAYMEVSVSDSEVKKGFIEEYFIPILQDYPGKMNLQRWPNHIYMGFSGRDYVRTLEEFIAPNGLKDIIDKILEDNKSYFDGQDVYNRIGFIAPNDFKKDLRKVKLFEINNKKTKELRDHQNQIKIKSVLIQGIGDVRMKSPLKMEIPDGVNWVFITGENGSGKSTVLRAITAYLNSEARDKYYPEAAPEAIMMEFDKNLDKWSLEYDKARKYATHGFAAYGASRLMTTENKKVNPEKTTDFYSIFEPDGVLNDMDSFLDKIKIGSDGADTAADVIAFLEEAFNDDELFPQIAKAELKSVHNLKESRYFEKDKDGNIYDEPLSFEQLSSGTRSLIALIGDLFCRLFDQLPFASEPADLYGVVLIDEIDVHFHPAMQKKIVEILSANFPKVQFIVTTHSAVTLLGAPDNSAFYRVMRSKENGITIEYLEDIKASELTPNLILTSPIFGFSDLLNNAINSDYSNVKSEDTWAEMKVNDLQLETLLKKYKARKENSVE